MNIKVVSVLIALALALAGCGSGASVQQGAATCTPGFGLEKFQQVVGSWSVVETDEYIIGVLPTPRYTPEHLYFVTAAIWRKDPSVPQFPPLLISSFGGKTYLTTTQGEFPTPTIVQTTETWPSQATTDGMYAYFRSGLPLDDSIPGMVGIAWYFPVETGQVVGITFRLLHSTDSYFVAIP